MKSHEEDYLLKVIKLVVVVVFLYPFYSLTLLWSLLMQIYQAWITNSKLFSQFFSISGVGDLSFSQSRLDDCHGSEVSELECLVSDNNENNNVCEIYKSDYIHHPHQPDHLGDEDVLEGHRDRRKDDSGCATASLEILSASCHTPATDLPSLNSLSLAREAEG